MEHEVFVAEHAMFDFAGLQHQTEALLMEMAELTR